MSHIPDMDADESGYVSVGWLHPDHSFPQADPGPAFLGKLKAFAELAHVSAAAFQFGVCCGFHSCEFCGRAHGTGQFVVPAGDRMFCSPPMIAHYVEAHRYAPPEEFVAAVLAAPLPGTREYVDAVAPCLARQRAGSMKDPTSITLERHVALVLFEFLTRLSQADAFGEEERADQVATWTLLAELESVLVEPMDPAYEELLGRARRLVVNYGRDEPDT
jgi:hypothetical protein